MQLCCDKERRCLPFACGIMSCRYTCVLWILLSFPPVQTDSMLPLFWFPRGRGLGRPWHLHTNENNHGKYVNLPGCGWPRQTVLFQKGHMLLWVITYGNWIHLTRTIKAQRLTRACDVLYAQCSTAQDDTCMLAFFLGRGVDINILNIHCRILTLQGSRTDHPSCQPLKESVSLLSGTLLGMVYIVI